MKSLLVKKLLSVLLCAALLLGAFPIGRAAQNTSFTDIDEDAYYYDAVVWALEEEITSGVSQTRFGPEEACTRGQVVTFLWRTAGALPYTGDMPFEDVKFGHYCYRAIVWALDKEITNGISETRFGANDACTRGQIVTFLWRFADRPEPKSDEMPFEDVSRSDYCYDAVAWAVEQGITTGISETEFSPNATCTRAQIVTFLHRYMTREIIIEPLTVVRHPEPRELTADELSAEFDVEIKGGVSPYLFRWIISYDGEDEFYGGFDALDEKSTGFMPTFRVEYFSRYQEISVYCRITDAEGTVVETNRARITLAQ